MYLGGGLESDLKRFDRILGHLSDTDICPTTEISFSDKRRCWKRIRKRTFVRKSVSIIFKTMLETMVYNVWVTGCSTVRCINVCLLVYHVIRRNTRQDGSPGFCPCWGGGESVENLGTSNSCWHGLLHLLLWVHLNWIFYHLTSLFT